MVLGIAFTGSVFNNVFYSLSGGLSLKVYRPELEPFFMEAFHYAMVFGGLIAGIGVITAFMRGPDQR